MIAHKVPCIASNVRGFGFGQLRIAGARKIQVSVSAEDERRTSGSRASTPKEPEVFQEVESLIVSNIEQEQAGGRQDWQQVDGCWILQPRQAKAEAVALFVGGAFVGAAPQVVYRKFLEALAARNIMVVAVPYETSFDHNHIADSLQLKISQVLRTVGPDVHNVPIYGMGHSLGAVLTLLLNARFGVHRDGNVLLSFNNRPATDTIPFLSPLLAPGTRVLGPILSAMATSPFRSQIETALATARSMAPESLSSVFPLLDQLEPVFLDVSNGRQEFTPPPQETDQLIQTYYNVGRNLLLQFESDQIDESPRLMRVLQDQSAISGAAQCELRMLDGDHTRPLSVDAVQLPPEVAQFATEAIKGSKDFFGSLTEMADGMGFKQARGPLENFGRQMSNLSSMVGDPNSDPSTDSVHELAEEIAAWMGVGGAQSVKGKKLPSPSTAARAV